MPVTKPTGFRLTEEELNLLRWLGEQLLAEGVYSIRTPSGEINLTAVIRHLMYSEERRRKDSQQPNKE
jgi:hypothetical protein